MIPEKLTIQELFSRERRFVIPLFQRSYVWNEEEQWAPLWEDIERRSEAQLKKLNSGSEGKVRSHFLGAVVLSNASAQGRSIARCDVIDGQQRLTTLQLFLAALRDQAFLLGAEEEDANIFRDLTKNPRRDDDSVEIFKVWPTNADQDVFASIMKAESLEGLRETFSKTGETLPRMAQAYEYFFSQIGKYVTNDDEDITALQNRFYCLMLALKESLQLVVIELEAEDDPQIIFETLNARGQPLLPSDLIRNFIFMKVGSEKSNLMYDKYWRQFDDERVSTTDEDGENRFWHLDERQGRLTRPRIDLFIFHYLKMKTENDIRISHLFREFKNWHEDSSFNDIEFLQDLKKHSAFFRKLIDPKGGSRLELFARRLRSLDTATLHPLLLFLSSIEGGALRGEAFEQCVADLESFMVRRFMCDLTPKNYNKFFLSVLSKAKAAHAKRDCVGVAIRSELMRSNLVTTSWPTDKQFKEGWMWKRLYVRSRPDRSAMVLKALQSEMRTNKNEHLQLIGNLSVEHLLPQNGSLENYPYADADLDDDYSQEEYRADCLHTVGNLTLLTGPLNASASNGPFPEKVVKICEDSDLRLNAWLRTDPPKNWDELSIEKRSKKLFKIAKKIWPVVIDET
jgi:uncharacterized protein with ParB-like and HNH nuclease domain